jgi:starvation-inducible DNA-binding protein
MSQSDQPPFLYPTRIDIPVEIRAYLITLLNQTLACTIDLRSQVKHASWNVKGNVFVQVRALCNTIAVDLDAYMDLVAERIAALGGVVQGTVRAATAQSTLPEYPGDLVASDAHVQALTERLAHYATAIRAAIEHTADVEDAATTNLYTDISRGIETRLGSLETYLRQ